MYENGRTIKIRGKKYNALFNVVALKKVAEKYGGIEGLSKALANNFNDAIGDFIWVTSLMIEQATAIKNLEENTNDKALTPEQIELLIKPGALLKQRDEIIGAINDGMRIEASSNQDEEEDEVLKEVLASKNEMGAKE